MIGCGHSVKYQVSMDVWSYFYAVDYFIMDVLKKTNWLTLEGCKYDSSGD